MIIIRGFVLNDFHFDSDSDTDQKHSKLILKFFVYFSIPILIFTKIRFQCRQQFDPQIFSFTDSDTKLGSYDISSTHSDPIAK